jgi:hypothetical protein
MDRVHKLHGEAVVSQQTQFYTVLVVRANNANASFMRKKRIETDLIERLWYNRNEGES